MGTILSRQKFLASDEAELIRVDLKKMTKDPCFNTKSMYSAASVDDVTFVEKHMKYLADHPKLNPQQYLSNVRLMTRIKP